MKIDAIDPQAAADNPPQPPVTMVRCPDPYNPPETLKTPSNSAVSWNVDACTILPQLFFLYIFLQVLQLIGHKKV